MGKSNTELLKIAQSHLGQGGARFRRFCGLPSGAAWCNAYVDYVANEGGDSSLYFNGAKYTYCPDSMAWCRKNLAQIPLYIALPMDIIYFDWDANNVPNHIGFVRERYTASEIYTIEGNTSNGIVAEKTRPAKYVCGIFRPEFAPKSFDPNKPLVVDSYFGYNSISVMQVWLKRCGCYSGAIDAIMGRGTIKGLQKKLGVTQDASWGVNTSKALQKLIGAKVDGWFGEESVKKFQTYLNKQVFTKTPVKAPAKTPEKTKAQLINETALKFAWKAGTPESVYKYPSGKPTPDFIKAWKKYFPGKKYNCGCHQYVNLVIKACGYKGFPSYMWKSGIIQYLKKNFQEIKVNYTQGQLQPGDIRVHKNDKGGYHIWVIVKTDGKYYRAEANQQGDKRYAHINVHNGGNTKHHKQDWLFRAK
jgi:hypothetical protein